jgi:hypothetical protein
MLCQLHYCCSPWQSSKHILAKICTIFHHLKDKFCLATILQIKKYYLNALPTSLLLLSLAKQQVAQICIIFYHLKDSKNSFNYSIHLKAALFAISVTLR